MRKPLMAGNWKMNLNHLEAIAVAQKLVYSLSDKDYDAVDIAILPPFTDHRPRPPELARRCTAAHRCARRQLPLPALAAPATAVRHAEK